MSWNFSDIIGIILLPPFTSTKINRHWDNLNFSWKGESTVLQGEEKPVDSSGFQEQDVKEVGDELDDGTEEIAKPLRKIAHFP